MAKGKKEADVRKVAPYSWHRKSYQRHVSGAAESGSAADAV